MYQILVDYISEGMSFWNNGEEFKTIDEAVKEAIDNRFAHKFYIVQVIDWEAREKQFKFPPEHE